MNDNLDTLSDAELSAVFAVELAGFRWFKWGDHPDAMRFLCAPRSDQGSFRPTDFHTANHSGSMREVPSFATDANAVLTWLEKWPLVEIHLVSGEWQVALCERYRDARGEHESVIAEGDGAIFASAACIALIRAKRAEKGAPDFTSVYVPKEMPPQL